MIRRRYRRRMYRRKVRRFYHNLKPRATREASRINKKGGSVRFIEYYRPCLNELNGKCESGTKLASLVAKLTKCRTFKAFNYISCLISGVPYIKYQDLDDAKKFIVRQVWFCIQQLALEYKFESLTPGAAMFKKKQRLMLNEAIVRQMEQTLIPVVQHQLANSATVKTRALQRLNMLGEQHLAASQYGPIMQQGRAMGDTPMTVNELNR